MLIDISSAANGAVPIDQLKIEKEAEANANLNQNPMLLLSPTEDRLAIRSYWEIPNREDLIESQRRW